MGVLDMQVIRFTLPFMKQAASQSIRRTIRKAVSVREVDENAAERTTDVRDASDGAAPVPRRDAARRATSCKE